MQLRASALLLFAAIALVSCRSDAGDDIPSADLDITVETDSDNVLRVDLVFETGAAGASTVIVDDGEGHGFRVVGPETPAGDQRFPILGLREGTMYTAEVTAGAQTGSTSFTTGELPDDLPPVEVESSKPDAMAPGLTLFDVIPLRIGEEGPPTEDGYLLVVDDRGEIVWYYRQTHSIQDARRTADGEILFIHHETGAKRLDLVEESVVEWSGTTGLDDATEDTHGREYAGPDAIRVETEQMHHEVIELPNGNLMTLSRELADVDGYPEPICDDDEEFSGSYAVATDTVVEFDPEDGSVLNEWSLFDLVDPLDDLDRIRASEFCSQYLAPVYPDSAAKDWTHANAVILDEDRNAILVSVRHLDQVFAIRYQDDDNGPAGELLWRLGENGDFTLTSGEWFLHPHAPEVLGDGSIMIYDNGNERPGTSLDEPDNLPYSRAVQYQIDLEDMTATQVWEHRADAPGEAVYAPFVGDADLLDGGTVLITHGGLLDPPAHTPQAEGVKVWGRVLEVDYETGDILFDLRVKDPEREASWIIYRSERIPTIYPEGYLVEQIGG